MEAAATSRTELREALQSAHAAELVSSVELERELRASIEMKHASASAGAQRQCEDAIAEQKRIAEAYRVHLESLRVTERRETQEEMHSRLLAVWVDEKANLERSWSKAIDEAEAAGEAKLVEMRSALDLQHADEVRKARREAEEEVARVLEEVESKEFLLDLQVSLLCVDQVWEVSRVL